MEKFHILVELGDGWKKTIDDSNDLVKSYIEKAEVSDIVAVATVAEQLQKAYDSIREGKEFDRLAIEEDFDKAEEAVRSSLLK